MGGQYIPSVVIEEPKDIWLVLIGSVFGLYVRLESNNLSDGKCIEKKNIPHNVEFRNLDQN